MNKDYRYVGNDGIIELHIAAFFNAAIKQSLLVAKKRAFGHGKYIGSSTAI
jgi:hypothetical protein